MGENDTTKAELNEQVKAPAVSREPCFNMEWKVDANESEIASSLQWCRQTPHPSRAKGCICSPAVPDQPAPVSPMNLRSRLRNRDGCWERRRGWERTDGVNMLSRIKDLADHLREHVRQLS